MSDVKIGAAMPERLVRYWKHLRSSKHFRSKQGRTGNSPVGSKMFTTVKRMRRK